MNNKTTIQVVDQHKKVKEENRPAIQQKIGFLGGGNMASAILQGLKQRQELEFVVIEPVEETRLNLLAMLPDRVTLLSQPTKELENCSILVLATKPQQLKAAFLSATPFLKKPLVISVAAGITTQSIEAWWASTHNESVSVVRTMPNTPALVGQGMTGLFASKHVSEAQKSLANKMMSSIGKTLWVNNEADLDMITALSGSGPAYFFWLMDQLVKQAVDLGLSPTQEIGRAHV
jgi:pyrroline-5-carboxylate reductase